MAQNELFKYKSGFETASLFSVIRYYQPDWLIGNFSGLSQTWLICADVLKLTTENNDKIQT